MPCIDQVKCTNCHGNLHIIIWLKVKILEQQNQEGINITVLQAPIPCNIIMKKPYGQLELNNQCQLFDCLKRHTAIFQTIVSKYYQNAQKRKFMPLKTQNIKSSMTSKILLCLNYINEAKRLAQWKQWDQKINTSILRS